MPARPRRRLAAAVALAAVVTTGLAVHVFAPRSVAADVCGDALYTAAVYCAVVLVSACRPLPAAAVAAVWSVAVELLQLTGIPARLAEEVPAVALVLGTGFDARDLVVYVAAAATAGILDLIVGSRLVASSKV